MATKKTPSVTMTKEDAPKTLKKHIFYGLNLDEKQEALRDALWDEEKRIVFVNAKSGTGKTLLSVAVGLLLVRYGFTTAFYTLLLRMDTRRRDFFPETSRRNQKCFTSRFIRL